MFGDSPPQPHKIGRFEVRELIGSGGMGFVYAADDPLLDRVVALKLLKDGGSADASQRDRVVREARALARLAHPNVVAIHEVGEHQGEVFIVMERVDGVGLQQWQAASVRTLAETLDRYLQAAEGLQAAHEAGIVHRDFKPSNVLVASNGRVRVADFGLARTLPASDGPARGTETTSGSPAEPTDSAIRGTPAYMAPEQMLGGVVDERTDQFSFCMALWEASFGVRPWEPSQVAAMAADSSMTSPPAMRRDGPRWLKRALERGLSASPMRRWPSMAALSQALRRGSRRRQLTLWGISVALLVVLAGVLLRATRQTCDVGRTGLAGVWDASTAEALRKRMETHAPFAAGTVPPLLTRLDDYSSAWVSQRIRACEATYVERERSEEHFDRSVACLQRARNVLRATVETLTSANTTALARADVMLDGLPSVEDCGDIEALTNGPEPPPASMTDAVAQLQDRIDKAVLLANAGETTDARALTEIATRDAAELGYAPILSEAHYAHGLALAARGESAEARRVLFEAATVAMSSRHHRLAVSAWHRLVQLAAIDLENPVQAREWNALAGSALSLLGPRPLLAAEHQDYAGIVASSESDRERAVVLHLEAAASMRAVLPADDLRVVQVERRAANAMLLLGRVDEAKGIYLDLEARLGGRVGDRHPEFARMQQNLGLVAKLEGDYEEARRRFERVLVITSDCFGEDSIRVAPALTSLAEIALSNDDLTSARDHAERAWQIQRRSLPRGHSERASGLALLAETSLRERALNRALEEFTELAAEFTEGAQAHQLGEVYQNIGWILCELDRCAEARATNERVHALAEPDGPLELYAEVITARIELAEGDSAAALDRLRQLLPKAQALAVADHPELVPEIEWTIAQALSASGHASADGRIIASIERAVHGYAASGTRLDAMSTLAEMRRVWLRGYAGATRPVAQGSAASREWRRP